ncbi:hypothetical protein MDAP_002874 [Mitosporidium daphniae]
MCSPPDTNKPPCDSEGDSSIPVLTEKTPEEIEKINGDTTINDNSQQTKRDLKHIKGLKDQELPVILEDSDSENEVSKDPKILRLNSSDSGYGGLYKKKKVQSGSDCTDGGSEEDVESDTNCNNEGSKDEVESGNDGYSEDEVESGNDGYSEDEVESGNDGYSEDEVSESEVSESEVSKGEVSKGEVSKDGGSKKIIHPSGI